MTNWYLFIDEKVGIWRIVATAYFALFMVEYATHLSNMVLKNLIHDEFQCCQCL